MGREGSRLSGIGYEKEKNTHSNEEGRLHPSQSLYHRKSLLWILGDRLCLSRKIFLWSDRYPPGVRLRCFGWKGGEAIRSHEQIWSPVRFPVGPRLLWSRSGPSCLQLGPSALWTIWLARSLSLRCLRSFEVGSIQCHVRLRRDQVFQGPPHPCSRLDDCPDDPSLSSIDRNGMGQGHCHTGDDLHSGLFNGVKHPVLQF